MKYIIVLAAILTATKTYATNELSDIQKPDGKPLPAVINNHKAISHMLNVKFKSTATHNDLLQTPETNNILNSTRLALSKSDVARQYNLNSESDRSRGLKTLNSIYQTYGVQIKHVRSAALGVDNIVALSEHSEENTINALMATGQFEYVKPVQRVFKTDFVLSNAATPKLETVGTQALDRNLFNDNLWLKQHYLDEQHVNAMGGHSFVKAGLYTKESKSLDRKIRIAIIDTGSFPHEDVEWSEDGADFVSSRVSNTYFDCAVQDENHTGEDIICALEDFKPQERDSDPVDKTWRFEVDQNGDPISDGKIFIDGHGLQVASTIGAIRNNSKGIIGAIDNASVELVAVRALTPEGGIDLDIADAIVWSAGGQVPGMPDISQKVDIINLSLGGFGFGTCEDSALYNDAISFARQQGVVVIGAAGNDGKDVKGYAPGACAGVLTVGANNGRGDMTTFSNYGEEVDVTFEGQNMNVATIGTSIYTSPENDDRCGLDDSVKTARNCYSAISGTSFAAPLASAAAALVKLNQPDLDESKIRALIAHTAPLYKRLPDDRRTLRAELMPFAGVGNAYLAATSSLDSLELTNLVAEHVFGSYNSDSETQYLAAIIDNSSTAGVCEVYRLSWGAYRVEIKGVNYSIYVSNTTDPIMTTSNSQLFDGTSHSAPSDIVNLQGFDRVAVQAIVDGATSNLFEFDLAQASKPKVCS